MGLGPSGFDTRLHRLAMRSTIRNALTSLLCRR